MIERETCWPGRESNRRSAKPTSAAVVCERLLQITPSFASARIVRMKEPGTCTLPSHPERMLAQLVRCSIRRESCADA